MTRYIEVTVKLPLGEEETEEEAAGLENLTMRGAGELLHQMGRSGTYWAIRTADPSNDITVVEEMNLHDHARSDDPEHNPSAYGRHDHEAPPWGAAHRHMNSLRSRPVPPVVVGCTNVAHDKVDCFAAGVEDNRACPKCQAALGRSFR